MWFSADHTNLYVKESIRCASSSGDEMGADKDADEYTGEAARCMASALIHDGKRLLVGGSVSRFGSPMFGKMEMKWEECRSIFWMRVRGGWVANKPRIRAPGRISG